jgi:hypothetical protein
MADKPIIFSAPMVQALLAGRKVQTRRTVQNLTFDLKSQMWRFGGVNSALLFRSEDQVKSRTDGVVSAKTAAYRKGDRLWVREAWKTSALYDKTPPRELPISAPIYFTCDDRLWPVARYRPSIHMPRWSSRLTLTVTDVRVQRLQDISEEDAKAEGVRLMRDGSGVFVGREGPKRLVTPWPTACEAFADLWDSINGPDAWSENPFVYAVSFTVHKSNIDALKAEAA